MNAEKEPEERSLDQVQMNWVHRRRDKIYQEIMANRRGDYTVPTWVLFVCLVAIVGVFATLVYIS